MYRGFVMKCVLCLAVALTSVLLAQPSQHSKQVLNQWCKFKEEFRRAYDTLEEEETRMKIFLKNLKIINDHNEKYKRGESLFAVRINHFSDMSDKELTSQVCVNNDVIATRSLVGVEPAPLFDTTDLPQSVDWRTQGAVTPVKDQDYPVSCGACWAFSAIGAVEGMMKIKYGRQVSLSEQQLVDCAHLGPDKGCHGGVPASALQYIKEAGGVDTESSYPYESKASSCRFDPKKVGGTVKGIVEMHSKDERQLQAAVAKIGPISVGIDAHSPTFKHYTHGVYNHPECGNNGTKITHAVLVVGYGTTSNGTDYWLIKNSWGEKWGMQGYVMLARNKNNQCSIMNEVTYPTA